MSENQKIDIQDHIISLLPRMRWLTVHLCSVNGYSPSSIYRAVDSMLRDGVIVIDEHGVLRRAGE